MSLYGMMRTGVAGMGAQASRLGTVADNIANADTTGYKKSGTEFSTFVLPSTGGSYEPGGVNANVRYDISKQGDLRPTTSTTDLAINGGGFFIVQDASGRPFLTRAGSFLPDPSGNLVNAAGFTLLGYSAASGTPSVTANGFAGLVPVNVKQNDITATPSTAGTFAANLPSGAAVGGTFKTSLVAYDNLGNKKLLDITFTKIATTSPPNDYAWSAKITDRDSGDTLATKNLYFDLSGQIDGAPATTSFTVPGGASLTLDLSGMTQLAADFTPRIAEVNGNGPSKLTGVTIGADGIVSAQYDDGATASLYQIALADVPSPDNLEPLSGNVYTPTLNSGDVQVGFPDSGSLGGIKSGALESSNVDLGTELTEMISAQRSYTANSKVFQTGSDLLNILVNLQR
jgi:flagellar hook protein FlgE